MKVNMKPYEYLCQLETFTINGVNADLYDFGELDDDEPHRGYGCGNMKFHAILPTQEILDKYGINADEYSSVCDMLDEKLSFGQCNWCA